LAWHRNSIKTAAVNTAAFQYLVCATTSVSTNSRYAKMRPIQF
jgi:hypothetical protein